MLRDMFADVREPSITVGSNKRVTVVTSVVVHTAIVAAAMIIPLVATDVLPTPTITTVFISTPVLTPPPPPRPPHLVARATPPHEDREPLAPVQPPEGITPENAREQTNTAPFGSIDGVFGGVADGIVDGGSMAVSPPPPPAPAVAAPVRAVGKIKPPAKIHDVKPAYPPIAQAAHVQGVVIIEATIAPDGSVQSAKVLRSIPLLDQAALEAVGQWQFTPTLLNGVAVPVIMTVTVNFTLQ